GQRRGRWWGKARDPHFPPTAPQGQRHLASCGLSWATRPPSMGTKGPPPPCPPERLGRKGLSSRPLRRLPRLSCASTASRKAHSSSIRYRAPRVELVAPKCSRRCCPRAPRFVCWGLGDTIESSSVCLIKLNSGAQA